jgi:hypothetical protein
LDAKQKVLRLIQQHWDIWLKQGIAIGMNAQATGNNTIAIGNNCINSTSNYIKFWIGTEITFNLYGVQFGNITFRICGSYSTIKNATSFDVCSTLKSTLSAPTNNNEIITKKYVDNLIPDLTNYLTADVVYVLLATTTSGYNASGMTAHNPDDDKLITKSM